MVIKITTPVSISRALNYNCHKEQEGLAECLHAQNFLKEANEMNFYQKLERFESNIRLNTRAKTNTLHISLNFSNADSLSKEQLIAICQDYMEAIGFKEQPYLIYEHFDAGHPHVHVVTTNIKNDGKRIDTFNIGKLKSNPARKALEIKYGLVKAEAQKIKSKENILRHPQKINYGKAETKRAITNILDTVFSKYKYTSLAEFNALLSQYNIIADRGRKDGMIFKHEGLNYRVLDETGCKVGVPIKASSIYNKPTLKALQQKFTENKTLKKALSKSTKAKLDWTLRTKPRNLNILREQLKAENISLVIRQNDEGIIYGLTYIDHNNKCVFNGSELGKIYSPNQLMQTLGIQQIHKTGQQLTPALLQHVQTLKSLLHDRSIKIELPKAIIQIIEPEQQIQTEAKDFKKKKRKRVG